MKNAFNGISLKPEMLQVCQKTLNDENEFFELLKTEEMDLKYYSKYRNVIEGSKNNSQNISIIFNDNSKEKLNFNIGKKKKLNHESISEIKVSNDSKISKKKFGNASIIKGSAGISLNSTQSKNQNRAESKETKLLDISILKDLKLKHDNSISSKINSMFKNLNKKITNRTKDSVNKIIDKALNRNSLNHNRSSNSCVSISELNRRFSQYEIAKRLNDDFRSQLKDVFESKECSHSPKINEISKKLFELPVKKSEWIFKHECKLKSSFENYEIEKNEYLKNSMKRWKMSPGSKLINGRNSNLNISVEERLHIFEKKRILKLNEQREKLDQKFSKFKSQKGCKKKDAGLDKKRNNEDNSQLTSSQTSVRHSGIINDIKSHQKDNQLNQLNQLIKEDLSMNQNYSGSEFKEKIDNTKSKHQNEDEIEYKNENGNENENENENGKGNGLFVHKKDNSKPILNPCISCKHDDLYKLHKENNLPNKDSRSRQNFLEIIKQFKKGELKYAELLENEI